LAIEAATAATEAEGAPDHREIAGSADETDRIPVVLRTSRAGDSVLLHDLTSNAERRAVDPGALDRRLEADMKSVREIRIRIQDILVDRTEKARLPSVLKSDEKDRVAHGKALYLGFTQSLGPLRAACLASAMSAGSPIKTLLSIISGFACQPLIIWSSLVRSNSIRIRLARTAVRFSRGGCQRCSSSASSLATQQPPNRIGEPRWL
jgi:hypothetical protein